MYHELRIQYNDNNKEKISAWRKYFFLQKLVKSGYQSASKRTSTPRSSRADLGVS